MATLDVVASTGAKLLAQVKTEGGWYEPPGFIGERDGIRTHDLLIKSQMLYQLSYALLYERGWSSRIGSTGQWMRKSAGIIGNRGRSARSGPNGDIAGFMLRADTEGRHREQDGEPDGQKIRTGHGDRNRRVRPRPSGAIFARQSVRVRTPPLSPFGHAALKTGSAMARPIASKPPPRAKS